MPGTKITPRPKIARVPQTQ